MTVRATTGTGIPVAELVGPEDRIMSVTDALDFMGIAYQHGARAAIVHERQLSPDFFDLSTGLAGEILQKCSNYGFRLGIVCNLDTFASKSLQAFVRESNRSGEICFVSTFDEALRRLQGG